MQLHTGQLARIERARIGDFAALPALPPAFRYSRRMTATTCGSFARSTGTSNVPAMASLSSSNCQSSVRRRAVTLVLPSCCPNTKKSATSSSAPENALLQ